MITDANNKMFVEAKNIGYSIDGKTIIDGFSYVFKPGHLFVLVGESGCGKTTLLSILARQLKPTKGCVLLSKDIKKGISFYSELGSCLFDLTVHQNLSMFSKDDACIDEVLSLVDLSDKKYQKTNTLSKGEIARLALARMILCDSPLIFFDEPTTNLDAENRSKFFSILRYMSKSKIVIVSNHDLSLIDKKDVILQYDNNHNFEQRQATRKGDSHNKIVYPHIENNNIKNHISIVDCFLLMTNFFKRSIKQFVILIPIFLLLFFTNTSSITFVSKAGNEIFYDILTSSNINGAMIQDDEINDDLIFDGISSNINGGKECVLLINNNDSITINHSKFTLQNEKDALIPSSYAKEFNLDLGDSFNLLIYAEEKNFCVSGVYQYNEIITDNFLSDVAEDKLSNIRMHNQPIIIDSQAIENNEISNSFKYAMADYFKNDKSLNYSNFILDCLSPNIVDFIVNKKSYNTPYLYFFWISFVLIIISLYFYAISTIKASQNDLLVFKLTNNKIISPIAASSLGGFIYLFCISSINLICSTIFFPLINLLINRFYLLNATINLLSASLVVIVSTLILLTSCAILLTILVIILGQLKIHERMNRLE